MKRKRLFVVILVLFVIIAGAAFPFYSWNKHYSYALTGMPLPFGIRV